MLAVALVLVCLVGLFVMDVISDVRFRREVVSLISGLRADADHLAGELARQGTERERLATAVQHGFGATHHQIASTHNTAVTALDRLLYYTKQSAILERLGAKYDKAIAKLRADAEQANAAKADAPADDPADAPAEIEAADTHAEAWADVDRDLADTAADTAPETTDDDMAKIVGSIGPAATPAGMPCG